MPASGPRTSSPSSAKRMPGPARSRRARRARRRRRGERRRRRSPRLRIRSTASSAARPSCAVALERENRAARKSSGTGSGFRRRRGRSRRASASRSTISSSRRLVVEPVGGVVVGDARRADPLDADEDLEQVVEARGGVVLDGRGAHREVAVAPRMLRARGAGGTRCARGRSTACSGRSRRRPARRCPRTPTRV